GGIGFAASHVRKRRPDAYESPVDEFAGFRERVAVGGTTRAVADDDGREWAVARRLEHDAGETAPRVGVSKVCATPIKCERHTHDAIKSCGRAERIGMRKGGFNARSRRPIGSEHLPRAGRGQVGAALNFKVVARLTWPLKP